MSLSNFLKNLFLDKRTYTGLILPPQEQFDGMIQFNEIVAEAAPVNWRPFDFSKLPSWPQYDQFYTYECVPNTYSLMASILYSKRTGSEIKFSPTWIYNHRANKPDGGMIGTDVFLIGSKVGSIPFDLLPTPESEMAANNPQTFKWFDDIAKVFQTEEVPIYVPVKDIDTLVSIQQVTDKPMMVWFEFDWDEWAQYQPSIIDAIPRLRHSSTFIPPKYSGEMTYGLLQSGEKAIIIQDSAGINTTQNGKRIITESFFKKRNIFASYVMRFKFDATAVPIHWDGSIISLQMCLRTLAYFPTNVTPVESYGNVTKGAVTKFQLANGLPGTGLLDEATRTLLKAKF